MQESCLPEDQDLLNELEAIGPMSTGTALAEQQRKINVVQVKAALRQRKTARDFDKSTTRFTFVLIAIGAIQIIVAMSQLLFSAATAANLAIGIASVVFCGVLIVAFFRHFDRLYNEMIEDGN